MGAGYPERSSQSGKVGAGQDRTEAEAGDRGESQGKPRDTHRPFGNIDTRKELAEAVGLGERTMGKVMQIDENAPEVIKEALDKKELSINKGYDLTRQLQDLPEEQREQAAAEALEYEKAKKELKKQDAEIDRKGKIAALFCKAYEKAVLLTPSEENVRCWTDGTRMTPEEMRDTVKESRELAEVFRTIADIIEQKILPADWRCADAESEENDAQSDGNPA